MIRWWRTLRLWTVEEHNMKTILTSIAAGSLLAALAIAQTAPRYTVAAKGYKPMEVRELVGLSSIRLICTG
jgi:hypothetical protein